MDEDVKTPEQNFSVVEFQFFPTYYHTWAYPVFVLESLMQVGMVGILKWEPTARTGVYTGKSTLHAESVSLVLNARTGYVSPQYNVVFDDTLSTVDHSWRGIVPVNFKN